MIQRYNNFQLCIFLLYNFGKIVNLGYDHLILHCIMLQSEYSDLDLINNVNCTKNKNFDVNNGCTKDTHA